MAGQNFQLELLARTERERVKDQRAENGVERRSEDARLHMVLLFEPIHRPANFVIKRVLHRLRRRGLAWCDPHGTWHPRVQRACKAPCDVLRDLLFDLKARTA